MRPLRVYGWIAVVVGLTVTSTGKIIYEADETLPAVLDTMTILRRAGFRVVVSRTGPTSVLRLRPGDVSGNLLPVAVTRCARPGERTA